MSLSTAVTPSPHYLSNELFSLVQHWYLDTGLSNVITMIDRDAALGALLGGWVVTRARRSLKQWQHLGSFLLSACVGYLFTPVAVPHLPNLSVSVTAFICALVALPISIKLMIWVNNTELADIVRRLRWPK
ncbi:MAG: putative holin [Pseudomonadota bacterium]